ncbi:RNA polymerase, sigma-24 subunit, ECF subfamily [Desulfofarcimen acetoxidans DSM 771]|uniref:RNA polymerase, sigma-24 subunit, ECF subfamily n=1 Tax=Desulfofarcimen acetoxidans (strain ATCC 49208 / DSM 771 / KCTC 5769 / VKM B-1644 / 5575) TaxID=485916 RepID=C8W4X3_DESAS|nr:RNA polymerase sigma factor [Desulfofarcimen acetoxidans]ACV61325.1 RNA polymerase, sigma-24 subunit, ECF subfamily [Desulfofarcimen acetoxidans DSM 771]
MDIPEEIIERVYLKDERAYEELFRLSWDQAVRICWLILRHQQDAEEVAQDAFLKLYVHRQHLQDVRAFRSWFYRILVNTALDKVRKRKAVINIDEIHLSSPSNDILQAERRMLIDGAMRHLSYGERTAVVLVHFIGCTEAEAAEAAGWKLGKLKYRLNRARRVLAQEINEEVKDMVNTKGGVQYV